MIAFSGCVPESEVRVLIAAGGHATIAETTLVNQRRAQERGLSETVERDQQREETEEDFGFHRFMGRFIYGFCS